MRSITIQIKKPWDLTQDLKFYIKLLINIKSGKIIINKKFNIPNKTDFSLIANIRPISPIILQINKLVRPVGLKFVKLSKISTGSK